MSGDLSAGRPLPRRAAWAGLGLVWLAGVVLVQEAAVRLALPTFNPSNHLRFQSGGPDLPSLGHPGTQRLINNAGDYDVTVTFNQHGLRDRRDFASSRPGDIFVLGDSFAFGWGVDEDRRFSDLLEARIDRPVFNIAAPMNLDDYPDMIAYAIGKGARIERIVLAINMADDLTPRETAAPVARAPAPDGAPLQTVKQFLLSHSALYFMATRLIHLSPWLKARLIQLGVIKAPLAAAANLYDASEIEQAVEKVDALNRRFDLVVMLIPDSGRWTGNNRESAVAVHDRFATWLRGRGIKLVDMVGFMERQGMPLKYQFAGDRHWRPEGHVLAADALAVVLKGP